MILAAGLTPAWQQILVFDRLRMGAVNRAREAHWCPRGKVLNVAIALHHLGGSSFTLALLGGTTGKDIDQEFESRGIAHRWIWSQSPTRVCTTILDRSNGVTTELVENATPVRSEELVQFVQAYRDVAKEARIVVLTGSLPTETPKTLYADLARETEVPVILDASGPELLAALPRRPFCVKPNREEVARSVGRKIQSDKDLERAMDDLNGLGAEWVVVSHGGNPLWARSAGKTYIFQPPEIPVVNPIGSGDCLAAGLAWALDQGMDMPKAICFGMAAAAENATMLVPTRLDASRVRARVDEIAMKQL